MGQRSPDQLEHNSLSNIRIETELLGLFTGAVEDDAFARVVARRRRSLDFMHADFGDDALSLCDQRDELTIDLRESVAQLFEYHSELLLGWL